jgi:hypothetical protein
MATNSSAAIKTSRDILEKYNNFALTSNKPSTEAYTNYSMSKESPELFDNIYLEPSLTSNKLTTKAYTNCSMSKESPIIFDKIYLEPSRPYTTATTSLMAPGTGFIQAGEYKRLQQRPDFGGFEGYKQIPKMIDNPVKRLLRG